jgi:hypothetical protein
MYVIKRIRINEPFGPLNWKWVLNRKMVLTNPEDVRKERNKYAKEYRLKHPRKAKCQNLRRHFNITLDEYEVILERQNGTCAICGNNETAVRRGTSELRYLAVDHCHESGKIRGLLCSKCNTGLGLLRDSKELLRKAIQYLTKDN